MRGNKDQGGSTKTRLAAPPSNADIIGEADLRAGDVLLYRPLEPTFFQSKISKATESPYTHAAIYLGDGMIADSGVLNGVTRSEFEASTGGSQCIAVLRSQSVFDDDRAKALNAFVNSVCGAKRSYDFVSAITFTKRSEAYFANQLDFIRDNYGTSKTAGEFAEQAFLCSAFVVACYAVVGIIGDTAQAAYQPQYFAPGHLVEDVTFGWLLGFLVPEGGSVPADDPLLIRATKWRDHQGSRWW